MQVHPLFQAGFRRSAIPFGYEELLIDAPAAPDDVVRKAIDAGAVDRGYWAHLWPTARFMTEMVGVSPLLEPGMRILEIGCGTGVVGIAAARRGADVLLTDACAESVALAAHNAQLNGVDARAAIFDWHGDAPSHGPFDLLIGSDVLYDRADHDPIARLIVGLGCCALLGDPNRPAADAAPGVFEARGLRSWARPVRGGRIWIVQA